MRKWAPGQRPKAGREAVGSLTGRRTWSARARNSDWAGRRAAGRCHESRCSRERELQVCDLTRHRQPGPWNRPRQVRLCRRGSSRAQCRITPVSTARPPSSACSAFSSGHGRGRNGLRKVPSARARYFLRGGCATSIRPSLPLLAMLPSAPPWGTGLAVALPTTSGSSVSLRDTSNLPALLLLLPVTVSRRPDETIPSVGSGGNRPLC
eukprot:3299790-Prymnesium_polylepis.4